MTGSVATAGMSSGFNPFREPELLPKELPDADRFLETGKHRLAELGKEKILASDQLPHDVRHDHLAPLSLIGNSCGKNHGASEQVVALGDGFTRVDSDADTKWFVVRFRAGGHGSLQRRREMERERRSRKRSHEAVAERLQFRP